MHQGQEEACKEKEGGGKGAHRGWCKVEGRGDGGERWVDAWCLCDRRCVVSESIHSGTCSSLPFTNSNPVKDEFPAPNELSFLLDDRNQQAFPEPQELYPPQSAGEQGRAGDVGRELGHLMSPQEAELDWYALLNSFAITMLSNSSTFVHYCASTNA